jgi:hypothetical protein
MRTLIIILLLALPALSQNTAVLWGFQDKCPAEAVCDAIVVEGANVRTIEHKHLLIAASFTEEGNYLVADIYVKNQRPDRVLVDPSNWVVMHSKSQEDFLKTAKISEPFYAINPDRVAYRRTFRWSNLFPNVKTAIVTTQSSGAVRSANGGGTYEGSSRSTVVTPDYQRRQQAEMERREAERQIMATAMKPNTIFSNQELSGFVYFKRSKKDQFTMAVIGIEKVNYIFYIVWK